jgi:signal transduction histidine kinase
MLPEFISSFSIGPLVAFSGNFIISILCFIASMIFRHYRPLWNLFIFDLCVTLCFLGWFIYALQISVESAFIGYRIIFAALALMPASWYWFYFALLNKKPTYLLFSITFVSLLLSCLALFGRSPLFFGFPFETDAVVKNILRPHSELLRPIILIYSLGACVFYFSLIIRRMLRFKEWQSSYLVPTALGLLMWLLGGINDTLRVWGLVFITEAQMLWFSSFWLSIFLTLAVILHFRSLEREVSRLREARIDLLEQSRMDLQRLNRAKTKALDHLSHELMTPLSIIQGNVRLLKRKAQSQTSPLIRERVFDSLERNLSRISNIQKETDQIIGSYQGLEINYQLEKLDIRGMISTEPILLYPFTEHVLYKVRQESTHRDLCIQLDGTKDLNLNMDSGVLEDILIGLLRNSIENTPDEGLIRVVIEQKDQWIQLKVQDFGVGITEENQRHIFSGLFHTLDTELYSSKKPYDFGAGGKGLNLLKLKLYGQRLGFDISVGSQRCLHLSTEGDLCHGKISSCEFCKKPEDCLSSGGSTFCVTFPLSK